MGHTHWVIPYTHVYEVCRHTLNIIKHWWLWTEQSHRPPLVWDIGLLSSNCRMCISRTIQKLKIRGWSCVLWDCLTCTELIVYKLFCIASCTIDAVAAVLNKACDLKSVSLHHHSGGQGCFVLIQWSTWTHSYSWAGRILFLWAKSSRRERHHLSLWSFAQINKAFMKEPHAMWLCQVHDKGCLWDLCVRSLHELCFLVV